MNVDKDGILTDDAIGKLWDEYNKADPNQDTPWDRVIAKAQHEAEQGVFYKQFLELQTANAQSLINQAKQKDEETAHKVQEASAEERISIFSKIVNTQKESQVFDWALSPEAQKLVYDLQTNGEFWRVIWSLMEDSGSPLRR